MSQKLSVSGTMYEANFIELNDEELSTILQAKENDLEWFEGNENLHDRIFGDSIINGFLVKDEMPILSVHLDGEDVDVNLQVTANSKNLAKPIFKNSVLVTEKLSNRAELVLEIDDEFEIDDFDLIEDYLSLPDGKIVKVVNPSYGSDDFEFQDSWTLRERTYLVLTTGQVVLLEDSE